MSVRFAAADPCVDNVHANALRRRPERTFGRSSAGSRPVLGGGTLWPVDTAKVIRLGVPADLPAVRDVFRSASLSNAGDRTILLAHPEHLILGPEGLNEGRTQVAEEDGSVVGFATWTDADGVMELEDLFVDPGWTRRGLATALVQGITDVMRARGVERLEVTANPHAMAFYTAVGFLKCGVARTEFGQAPRMVLAIH
jgi:GNAT superfamily N-acetyltransferase